MEIKALIPVFLESSDLKNSNIALLDGQPLCTYVINKICESIGQNNVVVLFEDEIVKKSIQRMEPYNKVNFLKCKSNSFFKKDVEGIKKNVLNNNIFDSLKIFFPDFASIYNPDWLIIVDPNAPLIEKNTINKLITIINKIDKNFVFFCTSQNNILLLDNDNKRINSNTAKIIFKGISAWKFNKINGRIENLNFERNLKDSYFSDISIQETKKVFDFKSFKNIESILKGKRLNDNNLKINYFNSNIKGIERDLISLLSKDGSGLKFKNFQFKSGKINLDKVIEKMGAKSSWSYPFVINGQDQVCLIQQIKNDSCRRHHHFTKAEFWVVLRGEFEWQIKNEKITVSKGEIIRLIPGETHVITCKSKEPGIRLAMGGAGMEHIYV